MSMGKQESGDREKGAEQAQAFACRVILTLKVGEPFSWSGVEVAVSEAGASWKAIRDAKTALKKARGRKQVTETDVNIKKAGEE